MNYESMMVDTAITSYKLRNNLIRRFAQ